MNNRALVSAINLIRPAQLVDKGSVVAHILNISGKHEVSAGFRAVITEGGAYKATLEPGAYPKSQFARWTNAVEYLVTMKRQQMEYQSSREHFVDDQILGFASDIDLKLQITYQITDPKIAALDVEDVVKELWDRTNMAVAYAVTKFDDRERLKKERIEFEKHISAYLLQKRLDRTIGITVSDVSVVSLKTLDTDDPIEIEKVKTWLAIQKLLRDAQLLPSEMTIGWLSINRPEIAIVVIQEAARQGIPPERLLGRQKTSNPPQPDESVKLPSPQFQSDRMREELTKLKELIVNNNDVNSKPGITEGVPDGSYDIRLHFWRSRGGKSTLFINCDKNYPNSPPKVELEVDGQPTFFDPPLLRSWSRHNYLIELVREAKRM